MVSMLQQELLRFGSLEVFFMSYCVYLYSLDRLVNCIFSMEAISVVADVSEYVRDMF